MIKFSKRVVLGCVLMGAGLAQAVPGPSTTEEWAQFLSDKDLVFEHPLSDNWGESLFIADGYTGASIYRMPGDEWVLRWEMGRTDVAAEYHIESIDWSIPRVAIGNVMLNPEGEVLDSNMRLDIWNAEATGYIKTDQGELTWRSLVEHESNTMLIEVETLSGEPKYILDFAEQWAVSPRFEFTDQDPEKFTADKLPPKPYRTQQDDIRLVVQPLTVRGAHVTAYTSEREGNTERFFLSIGKAYIPSKPQDKNIEFATYEAISQLRKAREAGVDVLEQRHRNWWHAYHTQAWVSLPDDDRWEDFYWRQIYKFGAASRADVPILIDNMGPWRTRCGWAGTWWNLNIQLSYLPTFIANRMDVGYSMVYALNHFYETGALTTPTNPEAITMGRSSTYYPWKDGGEPHDELGNLTWALYNYWRYYRYSMDEQVGRDLFPLLKGDMNYYFDLMRIDGEGKIHLPPMISPEYNVPKDATWAQPPERRMGPIPDTNYSHQMFRWGLNTLLTLNEQYGLNDADAGKWQDTLDHLIDLPVGENGLKISAGVEYALSHRHYSHLVALYPLHTINPDQGKEAEELFRKSLEHWWSLPEFFANYSFTGSACMYATLGEGDRALEILNYIYSNPFKGFIASDRNTGLQPNTMYTEGGGPVIETMLSATESIGYMLLQSWGGVLRVYPAVPEKWANAFFRDLRGEGAFLVSAERKNGITQWVEVKSLAGAPCVLELDFDAFEVEASRDLKVEKIEGPRGQIRWTVDLQKDESVLLKRK